jgi:hypothetical protein
MLKKIYYFLLFFIPGLILFFFYLYYGSLYGGDTYRYVNAGYKTFEFIGINFKEPQFYEHNLSLRAYIQLIPNLIIFLFSRIPNDGINFFPILNIFLFIYIFYIYFKNFIKNFNISKIEAYIVCLFLFFGFYQIPGWTLKILSETLFIFFSIVYFDQLFFKKKKMNIIFLSIALALIRPQGVLYLLFTLIFFLENKIKKFKIKYIIFFLFISWFLLIPYIIHLQLTSKNIIFLPAEIANYYAEGNINDGWLYLNGDLNFIINKIRWVNTETILLNSDFAFIFLVNLIRTIYSIIPLRLNYSLLINIWFFIYFITISIIAIKGLKKIKMNNISKFHLYILILLIIIFFNNIMVIDNFRYNLMLIVFIWQLIKFKYNSKI